MTTRILSLLALAALAIIALAHSTPADAAAKRRCGDTASSAKTLVKTKTSVVFVRKARSGPDKGYPYVATTPTRSVRSTASGRAPSTRARASGS